MKIDRMMFDRFADRVREDATVKEAVEAGQWDRVIDYVNREVFEKPEEYYNLEKLRKAAAVDRRLTLREILERVFDLIPDFKSRDELLEEEFAKFVAQHDPPRYERRRPYQDLLQGLRHRRHTSGTSSTGAASPCLPPIRCSTGTTSERSRSRTASWCQTTSRTTFH